MKAIILSLLLIPLVGLSQQKEVYYANNIYKLTTANKTELKAYLKTLNKGTALTITGHTDIHGDADYNLALSERRANRVADFLKAEGFTNLSIDFKGETEIQYRTMYKNRRDSLSTSGPVKPIPPVIEEEVVEETEGPKFADLLTEDRIHLENIAFYPGTPNFLHRDPPRDLYELAEALKTHPKIKIEVAGHVCCVADEFLSEQRAKKVYEFLVGHGVPKERMTYKGYSNTQPLVPEISAENNQKNRRVEINITSRD